ncbi:MAG: mechanosensitive ion channel family protein [Nitrososphaerota archaeon]|jgi:small-conductance mechanosensitive channel|nr:mechanosensitive ion channel family protein [Nitrososphaerota archaeon]
MSLNESTAGLSGVLQQTLNISPTIAEILVSIILFSTICIIGLGLSFIISKYVSKWTTKSSTNLDDKLVASTKTVILIIVGVIAVEFALSPLSILDPYRHFISSVFFSVQILLVAYAASKITDILIDWYTEKTSQQKRNNSKHLMGILKKITQATIFIIALVVILISLEIDGLLLAVLSTAGAAGIIIAFALQNILNDFFSAFAIYFGRPFEIDDFIILDEHSGTVKNIGILTTRIQLLQGEELVVPNKQITSTSIRNFRKLAKRRIVFNIGINYDTPTEKLERTPQIITDAIKTVKGATPQFVNFNEFGEYSLKFFISYFVHAPDYGNYLATQQQINIAIKAAFEREGIEMAYLKNVTFIKK